MQFKFFPHVSVLVHEISIVPHPLRPCRGYVDDSGIYDRICYNNIEIDIYLLMILFIYIQCYIHLLFWFGSYYLVCGAVSS